MGDAGLRLFHVSEDGGIERFVPRLPPNGSVGIEEPVVWAVEEARLVNYLLPRDCPRVTFYAGDHTTVADAERLLGPGRPKSVVAIEAGWLARVRAAVLYLYAMPGAGFTEIDRCAGYWVSRAAVVPFGRTVVTDCLAAILERGAELRVMPSLWALHDSVVASTLEFSCIRMRNARPRDR